MVEQYLEHSRKILTKGEFKGGSKGSKLISLFGHQNEYDLREGFPLLTTRSMAVKGAIHELIWFLRGETNIKYLEDNNVMFWRGNAFEYNLPNMVENSVFPAHLLNKENKYKVDWDKAMEEYAQRIRESAEFAQRFGDAGPIYGYQWRRWKYFDEKKGELIEIDQLGQTIEEMRKKPVGKRHLITAWNPGDIPNMSLPSCHVMYQMTANDEGQIDLLLFQRSCDQFLGVPINIASYAMLLQIIAQELGLEARYFIHTFGDSHFYTGLEKRGQWYKQNLPELKERVKHVRDRRDYLNVLEWVKKNAPSDEREERYDHVTAILEQLSREPKPLPRMHIARRPFDKLTIDDFTLEGYEHHPAIKRSMAV